MWRRTLVARPTLALWRRPFTTPRTPSSEQQQGMHDAQRVMRLIAAYKDHGHMIADVDPLGLAIIDPHSPPFRLSDVTVLQPEFYGFTHADRHREIFVGDQLGANKGPMSTLNEIVMALQTNYCGTLAVDYTYIPEITRRAWCCTQATPRLATSDRTALPPCRIDNRIEELARSPDPAAASRESKWELTKQLYRAQMFEVHRKP